MDLSRICIDPRLRSSWEAVDLGFMMARRWYVQLLLCWSLPCLPLALLIGFLFSDRLWLALLLIWWCKPLFDRLPLVYISQALFSEPIRVADVLRQLPQLWRNQWLTWLTTRRFSFTRSFDMPVTILERLSGKSRDQRLNVLHRQNTGAGIWLTIVCAHLEILVTVGCFAFIALLIPDQLDLQLFTDNADDDQTIHWADFLMYCIAMAVIAPFYVASGFALYISRRIELEAWDVEIRFRQLAAKQSASASKTTVTLLLVGLLGVFGAPNESIAVTPEASHDQFNNQENTTIQTSDQAKQLIEKVLAGDDFHVMEEVTRWRIKPIHSIDGSDNLPNWFMQIIAWLETWLFTPPETDDSQEPDFSTLALILEIILWCAAIIGVGVILYIYRRDIQELLNRFTSKPSDNSEKPQILFGLEVSEESLPDDIPQQVRHFCSLGDYRQALSLLYRATLSGLMHRYGYSFYDSYTEGECIQVVRGSGHQDLSQFTETLTDAWQQLAYGHHMPSSTTVDQLCRRWQELFRHED